MIAETIEADRKLVPAKEPSFRLLISRYWNTLTQLCEAKWQSFRHIFHCPIRIIYFPAYSSHMYFSYKILKKIGYINIFQKHWKTPIWCKTRNSHSQFLYQKLCLWQKVNFLYLPISLELNFYPSASQNSLSIAQFIKEKNEFIWHCMGI